MRETAGGSGGSGGGELGEGDEGIVARDGMNEESSVGVSDRPDDISGRLREFDDGWSFQFGEERVGEVMRFGDEGVVDCAFAHFGPFASYGSALAQPAEELLFDLENDDLRSAALFPISQRFPNPA